VHGARQNNLQGFDVSIPHRSLTVVTGPSGSGKSSLAFDILYAEGQRRYVESFSAYARQFLDRMDRAKVDSIEGVPPAIAIGQRPPSSGARSTVATMTEISDHARLLWARAGTPRCPGCRKTVFPTSPGRVAEELPDGKTALIAFPRRIPPSEASLLGEELLRLGFRRIIPQGQSTPVTFISGDDLLALLPKGEVRPVDVLVDRVRVEEPKRKRIVDSLETAFRFGQGEAVVILDDGSRDIHSMELRCSDCNIAFPAAKPHLFSFNSPVGACPTCTGFGRVLGIDPRKVVPDPRKSLSEGAIKPWTTPRFRKERAALLRFCEQTGISTHEPWSALPPEQIDLVFHGQGAYPGIAGFFRWLETKTYKMHIRILLSRYRRYSECPACRGKRLRPAPLCYEVGGIDISTFHTLTAEAALDFVEELARTLDSEGAATTEIVRKELLSRLCCLRDVGLPYLTLDRSSRTLSGGEIERVDLTTALGSRLSNTLFVLDEPSVGLHPRDNIRLLRVLQDLKRAGNTVVVVEHDPELMSHADRIIDLGPGSGEGGGNLVAEGSPDEVALCAESLTAPFLLSRSKKAPGRAREVARLPLPVSAGPVLRLRGARTHNLTGLDVVIPLGRLVVVVGVSGSGKSSLVVETLVPALQEILAPGEGPSTDEEARHDGVEGASHLGEVCVVDQKPIGTTPRGNAATYSGALDPVRKLFARTPLAVERGYGPGTFSFNVPGGRCETCEGDGCERIEMQFLADVHVQCEECLGRRFRREVLEVRWRDHSIADILDLTVERAMLLFMDEARVLAALQPLRDVGLGYLRLGQPLSTLSGGEGQRVKLAARLGGGKGPKRARTSPPILFVLDEPTTGLHPADVRVLVAALDRLVQVGHTVVVIEHNLELIACADHVLELGPEGGPGGGRLVFEGPTAALRRAATATGIHLAAHLSGHVSVEADTLVVAEDPGSGHPLVQEHHDPTSPSILVLGAREHNLRDVSVAIPRGKLTVVTGPSGSGKSTLAFDILFAEGQRRYIDSLSAYARQYVQKGSRPDVDLLLGLPPTIAIEQRLSQGGARSTVATVTEIWHYLRLLFARIGDQTCPDCGIRVEPLSRDAIEERIRRRFDKQSVWLTAPVIRARKGLHKGVVERARKLGLPAVRIDGKIVALAEWVPPDRHVEHDVDLAVALLRVERKAKGPLRSELERALDLGKGVVVVSSEKTGAEELFSTHRSCGRCSRSFDELDPRDFSFNSRRGKCQACDGKGVFAFLDPDLLVAGERSLDEGALLFLEAGPFTRAQRRKILGQAIKKTLADGHVPFASLPTSVRKSLLGPVEVDLPARTGKKRRSRKKRRRRRTTAEPGDFDGIVPQLLRLAEDGNEAMARHLESFTSQRSCPDCAGGRLRDASRAVKIEGHAIDGLAALSVKNAHAALSALRLEGRRGAIGRDLVNEVVTKLSFLEKVGLGYLTLGRPADSLSGGEAQRVRLAAGLGSRLAGAGYVLDEPTIGLHPRDNQKLVSTLRELCHDGNTVVVVEHDPDTILAADHLIELGPGGGTEGGQVVAKGAPSLVLASEASLTGRCLARRISLSKGAAEAEASVVVRSANEHNLRHIDVRFPLQRLVGVSGVSGSGKTTLVREILYRSLKRGLGQHAGRPGRHGHIEGMENVHRVVEVDQSPLGRTSRSIPASYVGFYGEIRRLFSMTELARLRGYEPGRFSFNIKGGRCENCRGQGRLRLEMSFLPDASVPCAECGERRFTAETLDVRYRGKSIADVLDMTIAEARDFFAKFPRIEPYLRTLDEVGLSYLTLGQTSSTLSGGEAERIKLAAELGGPNRTPTLFILDEPTTGLHLADIERLLSVLRALVDKGHSVIVIEHNLHVLAQVDWILDLGPGGGDEGGRLVAEGPPARVARSKGPTGSALREFQGRKTTTMRARR